MRKIVLICLITMLPMKCFARNSDEVVICEIEIDNNRVSSCYGRAGGINGRVYRCVDYAKTVAKAHGFTFEACESSNQITIKHKPLNIKLINQK